MILVYYLKYETQTDKVASSKISVKMLRFLIN